MKILIINHEFPPIGGGAATASENIANQLSVLGEEVVVLTGPAKKKSLDADSLPYNVRRIPSIRKRVDRSSVFEMGIFLFSLVFFGFRIIRDERPDILIVFFSLPSGPGAWVAHKRLGIPYILSLRGGDVPGFLPNQLRRYHYLTTPLTKTVWRNASAIVANSKGLQQLAQQTGNSLGISVKYIPNGINFQTFVQGEKREKNTVSRVLFVGRIVQEQKGLEFLIPAMKILKGKMNLPVQLDIVGDGPYRRSLERLIQHHNLESEVNVTGWLTRTDLLKRYHQADLFVLPSLEEGMPNVLMEAMAAGLPVVVTDIGGNCQLVSQDFNGFLVPPRNSVALASAMAKLIQDPVLRNAFGEKGAVKIRDFDWERIGKGYLELCKKVVSNGNFPRKN